MSLSNSVREWLLENLTSRLAQAFEAMAGALPQLQLEAGSSPAAGSLIRRQPFHGIEGALWISAAESDWIALGNEVMRAAGINDADTPTLKSTYLETIDQAFSALATSITSRLGKEVTCATADETTAPPSDLSWTSLRLSSESIIIQLGVAFEPLLVNEIVGAPAELTAPVVEPASKTFDLLLDVELPVSVSFGRAQVAIKDLIKLTTGSIVELNRAISEPVEVIVNNCVIARGEVVVVEGNFGVRIQQVVSRQERLRTLA